MLTFNIYQIKVTHFISAYPLLKITNDCHKIRISSYT